MNVIDPATLCGNWSYPTTIRFGPARVAELPAACKALNITHPLIVTDPGIAEHEIGAKIQRIVEQAGLGCSVFAEIKPNPTGANVEAGVAAFKRGRHDGVIALGGGSGLDAAKAVAFMAGQDRPLWDFEDVGDNWTRARSESIAPIVALPTTAGTGSEVGRAAVVTHEGEQRKYILFHPRMLPGQVIADPELTIGLPAHLTAWTGLDALSHSLEALCAPGFHPVADGIATEAMRLVHQWLKIAVQDGTHLAARAHMLAAASMGAMAFQKGLGAMHAMAHPLGALLDCHHGRTVAAVMPYVLETNRLEVEARIGRLARHLGLTEASFDAFLEWVLESRRRYDVPHDLRAMGMTETMIDRLSTEALRDPSAGTNSRLLDQQDYAQLFHRALEGRFGP